MMSPNLESLTRVATTIRSLLPEVVLVGGHLPALLVDEPGTRVRPTMDVDIVASIVTRTEYFALGERLRKLGLREDTREGAPLCRWITPDEDIVDVMPLGSNVLFFSNRWYGEAIATASPYMLHNDIVVRVPSAAAFLATKFLAYAERGRNDLFFSHDIEDIIVVVAGRSIIVEDVSGAREELRSWLANEARQFLALDDAYDAVSGALPDSRTDQSLIPRTLARFEAIAAL